MADWRYDEPPQGVVVLLAYKYNPATVGEPWFALVRFEDCGEGLLPSFEETGESLEFDEETQWAWSELGSPELRPWPSLAPFEEADRG